MADVWSVNCGGKDQWGPWVSIKKDCESHWIAKLLLCAVSSPKLCNHTYLLYFIRSDNYQYLSSSWSTDVSRTLSVSDNTQQNLKQVSGPFIFSAKFSRGFKGLKQLRVIKHNGTSKPSTKQLWKCSRPEALLNQYDLFRWLLCPSAVGCDQKKKSQAGTTELVAAYWTEWGGSVDQVFRVAASDLCCWFHCLHLLLEQHCETCKIGCPAKSWTSTVCISWEINSTWLTQMLFTFCLLFLVWLSLKSCSI